MERGRPRLFSSTTMTPTCFDTGELFTESTRLIPSVLWNGFTSERLCLREVFFSNYFLLSPRIFTIYVYVITSQSGVKVQRLHVSRATTFHKTQWAVAQLSNTVSGRLLDTFTSTANSFSCSIPRNLHDYNPDTPSIHNNAGLLGISPMPRIWQPLIQDNKHGLV